MVHVWRDDERASFAEAAIHQDGYRLEWRGIGTVVFSPGSLRVRLWPAPGVDADAATAALLHVAQPAILQALGYQTLHASAVRLATGVVAFCGVSGAGKSTLAFALGRSPGMSQMADDALVLEIAREAILAQPLPYRARLRSESRTFFNGVASHTRDRQPDSAPAPLLAVFALTQSQQSQPIELRRIGAPQAFSALLTHAHCFDESDRAGVTSMVQAYLAMADAVPVYALAYPKDFAHIRDVQMRVLEAVGQPQPHDSHA
ncbi:MAG: hypothetical protein ABI634_06710 [Acidobacteriota bacterium]